PVQDADLSAVGEEQPQYQLQYRRLSGTGLTGDHQRFTLACLEGHAIQDRLVEGQVDILQRDHDLRSGLVRGARTFLVQLVADRRHGVVAQHYDTPGLSATSSSCVRK